MENMLISVLSAIGLGINGVVTKNANIYAGRLGEFIRDHEISLVEDNGKTVTFNIANKYGRSFTLLIELRGESRAIKGMTIYENKTL